MAGYTITFHSPSEGISFGVTSDSVVSALSLLVEEFGEGAVPLFEHARQQFLRLCAEVELSVEDPIAPARTAPQRPASPPKPVEIATEDLSGEVVGGQGSESVDEQDERNGTDAVTGGGDDATGMGGGAGHEGCVICNAPVTADRAQATRFMTGEVRCMDCAT